MAFRPAYSVPLVYGGNTVWLKPSLRAAMRLESLHNGFPALLTKIQQHDTTTLRKIITYAATDQDAAQALLNSMADKPLRTIQSATLGPALALVTALMMPTPETGPVHKGGLIHHSDRGGQYLSIRYTERLALAGIEPSVGSVGDSYDNAPSRQICFTNRLSGNAWQKL